MMISNRKNVFDGVRSRFGALSQQQVEGLNNLLDQINADPAWNEMPRTVAIRQISYALATVKHETAHTFQPIDERGNDGYFERRYGYLTSIGRRLGNDAPGEGAKFHGRGDVQLTGEDNYEHAENELIRLYQTVIAAFELRTGQQFDLTGTPEQAKDPAIAYCIMSAGMRLGWFTGRKLADFINESRYDPVRARQIINSLDCADVIAGYARIFESLLQGS